MSVSPVITQELRALLVYDALPSGCIAKPVKDGSLAPHLRPGEFAIVDTTDCDLINGEIYLVAWMGSRERDGSEKTALVQAFLREEAGLVDGGLRTRHLWSVGSMRGPQRSKEEIDRLIRDGRYDKLGWSNGPYREGALEEQIRGRVVAILAPSFEEPRRLTGGAA